MTLWLSSCITALPTEQWTIQLQHFEMICHSIALYYSTGIDRASYSNINFTADIWPVQGGEMNALLWCIPVWVADHPEDVTVGSCGSDKKELQFRKGLWTLLIDSS